MKDIRQHLPDEVLSNMKIFNKSKMSRKELICDKKIKTEEVSYITNKTSKMYLGIQGTTEMNERNI